MTTKMRLSAAGGVVAAALLIVTLAPGSGAEPRASSSRTSVRAPAAAPTSVPASVVGSRMVCPAVKGSPGPACAPFPLTWCCRDGPVPGVTVTGQAALRGIGAKIRDQAIAEAVADARDQAEAAAEAAGVGLGQVIAMQISSSGYPYPLEAGVGK